MLELLVMQITILLATIVLFLLPLLPALREWRAASDAEPLSVARQQSTDIRHFARSFASQVAEFRRTQTGPATPEQMPRHTQWRGAEAVIMCAVDSTVPDRGTSAGHTVPEMLICAADLRLRHGARFEREIYADGDLEIGDQVTLRAAYTGGDARLGVTVSVARWLHAERDISTGAQCRLYGRVSCGGQLVLGAATIFERLNATEIISVRCAPTGTARTSNASHAEWQAEGVQLCENTVLFGDALAVPPRHHIGRDIVSRDRLTIGPHCSVNGKLKAHRDLVLGEETTVSGAVTAVGRVTIGKNCMVDGPIVSETAVHIEEGAIIGAPGLATTVTAPEIIVAPGVRTYGTLWARKRGKVLSRESICLTTMNP